VKALLAVPAAVTLYLGFNSGGFFPDVTGLTAGVLSIALMVRITLAERPFAGVSGPLLIVAGALGSYAVLALISASWSGAPSRAVLEFDRALLYLLALVALGSLSLTRSRLEWSLRALAIAVVVVCFAGFVSRVAPDVLPTASSAASDRLSYPVSYWNALGLLAVIGVVFCLHLSSERRESRVVQALGAAAIPVLGATLLLTFSRGAIVTAAIALLAYALLARSIGVVAAVLAAAPPTGFAVAAAYGAKLLADDDFSSPAAIAQGHELAGIVLVCMLAAVAVRVVLGELERTIDLATPVLDARHAGTRRVTLAVLSVLAGIVLVAALDVPDRVERQYALFVADEPTPSEETRERLASVGNNGRIEQWQVALEAFRAARLTGQGAGTFQVLWARDRDSELSVVDGHSLYFETLAELGVVGLVLLGGGLAVLLGALVLRARGAQRGLYGALAAAVLAWAVHTGVDWHWEMPAVTAWVFALGGLAIAAPAGERAGARGPAPLTRIVAALGCLLLAVTPALAALSQQSLDESVAAFRRGDCTRSADAALTSISYLSVRPQPFELLAYCDVRAGLSELAVRSMGKALARDPANWEYHYGLALVRGAAGLDPRPQAAAALALNPLNPLTREAAIELGTADSPQEWRRRAVEARLPLAP